MKREFNRLLNACFTVAKLDRGLVIFLYRVIRYFIWDDIYYRNSFPAVPREVLWPEFRHQFKKEFGVELYPALEPPVVNLYLEWPRIHMILCNYENMYPELVSGLARKLPVHFQNNYAPLATPPTL